VTVYAITGARILSDNAWLDDHAILMGGGRIHAIVPQADVPVSTDELRLDGGMLLPGFIDTQVNGGGGKLFNDDPSVDTIATIAAAHQAFGTTALLPTLISDDFDVIAAAVAAVDAAILAGVPGILGIHIEGPFLNTAKRGIHDAGKFRTLDDDAIALLSSLKHGKTLITLAPEHAPSGAIAALAKNGAIIAAGHSLASYEDMQAGMDEGLSGVTHLFNAMTQMEGRAPGIVGAALESDLICGIIVDGHHVHPASLRAAFRAKGPEQLMLVTDAMPTVGSNTPHFMIGDVEITEENGALRSADGTLAGSNLNMAQAVRNAVSMMQVPLIDASQMASATPAGFLGLGQLYGKIAAGCRADFVHLDDRLNVQNCWIAGQSDRG
jgi:N-acetylglucosamine-6-phosphate deacetylase